MVIAPTKPLFPSITITTTILSAMTIQLVELRILKLLTFWQRRMKSLEAGEGFIKASKDHNKLVNGLVNELVSGW